MQLVIRDQTHCNSSEGDYKNHNEQQNTHEYLSICSKDIKTHIISTLLKIVKQLHKQAQIPPRLSQ